ncbi:MAG: OmpH family outer membrane protein [Candidatus Kapabacteria bacterium]|nr:OmpH family outer membrane protein [Candidatus Kapabacteria bacterium]
MNRILIFSILFIVTATSAWSQKVGFIASSAIRERWQDMQQAQQRIQSLVDDWKRELANLQKQVDDLEIEVKKNRLVWTAEERAEKETLLERKRKEREDFAHKKFDAGAEYDEQALKILKPVEEKLYNTVQEVAAAEGYDIVLDKSTQPIPYINPKYDLTVKVMKKLNIPADDLEEKQKKAIEEDPRNKKKDEPTMPRKRSRSSSTTEEKKDDDKKEETKKDEPKKDAPKPDTPEIPR